MRHLSNHLASLIAVLAITGLVSQATAVDNVSIKMTCTIAADISIAWSNAAGNSTATAQRTYGFGTVTCGSGPHLAGVFAPEDYRYIKNIATSTIVSVDVDAVCADSASWQVAAAVGVVNKFLMEGASDGVPTWKSLHVTQINFIAGLGSNAVTANALQFQFTPPTSINAGVGVAQDMVVTLTASVAN